MEAIRRLQWKAILAGVAALLAVSFLAPLLLIALLSLFPGTVWLSSLFVWLMDDPAGRGVVSIGVVLAGFGVAYRVASQDKALHGCLAPVVYLVGFTVLATVASVAFGAFGGS